MCSLTHCLYCFDVIRDNVQQQTVKLLFRLRRAVFTHQCYTTALRVSAEYIGHQVLRSSWPPLLLASCQCTRNRGHQRQADVVHSEREAIVGAQSQVSSTVSAVSRCTEHLWTVACPQCRNWPTRFVG